MILNVYLIGAGLYAVLMALYSSTRGFCDRPDAEIFGTVVSALLWPITMPIDFIALVLRRTKKR